MSGQPEMLCKYGKALATPAGRLSFPKVFKVDWDMERKKLQFSCSILIPKIPGILDEIVEAATAVAREVFGAKWSGDLGVFGEHCPIKDGDLKKEGDPANGHWIITSNSNENRKPFIFDRNKLQIEDESAIYGGAIGILWVQPMAYDKNIKVRGVKWTLDAVQKIGDAEPFGRPRFNPITDGDVKSEVPDYLKQHMTSPAAASRPAAPSSFGQSRSQSNDDVMRREFGGPACDAVRPVASGGCGRILEPANACRDFIRGRHPILTNLVWVVVSPV